MILAPTNLNSVRVVPTNPNSVQVGMVRTGCLKTQFNSAYPARLNGIISQHDFQESIHNINSKISSQKQQIFCVICFAVFLIGGLILVIIGAATASSIRQSSFPFIILLFVGVGLIGFSPMFLSIGCCVVRMRRTTKMRKAIAEESKKYSMRTSAACRWRLNISRYWTVGYRNRVRTVFVYHVLIDLPHPAGPRRSPMLHTNQAPSRPASNIRPQIDVPPPPYPGPPGAFCSQCGTASPGPVAKFCSSCGYQFNTY